MGVFFTSSQPVVLVIKTAIENALLVDPSKISTPAQEAAKRALDLTATVAPKFNPWRFVGAVLIAGALLYAAIWTAQHDLPDISKALMNSFAGFSGIVLGLLGGEAQTSA
jgi:hypothetical protein